MEFHYFENSARVNKGYYRALEPVCSRWNLTRSEVDVLLFLFNNPTLDRAADIVKYRGIVKSHVSLSVALLEEKRLLQRLEDPEDRRAVRLKLTESGCTAAAQARSVQMDFLAALYQGITPEEYATWRIIARKIHHNINNMDNL